MIKICLCLTVTITNAIVEVSPILQKISKKKLCEIETDSILASEKLKRITSHLSKKEKEKLPNLKELQIEFCNQSNE